LIKKLELKANTHLKLEDDKDLYERIMKIIALAILIAPMDPEEAEKVQKTYLENL